VAQPAENPRPSSELQPSREVWTVDDLLELPDSNKYEILDGGLFVSPMADPWHHRIADRIMIMLDQAAPPGWMAIREIGVKVANGYLGPDVAVLRPGAPMDTLASDPSLVALVVEVESKNSRRYDRFVKPPLYAEAGVESYWRVERTADGPIVHLHQNGPGGFVLEQTVKTDERHVETLPFEIVLEPATWMR
jgi:Uma2 family endonuclease